MTYKPHALPAIKFLYVDANCQVYLNAAYSIHQAANKQQIDCPRNQSSPGRAWRGSVVVSGNFSRTRGRFLGAVFLHDKRLQNAAGKDGIIRLVKDDRVVKQLEDLEPNIDVGQSLRATLRVRGGGNLVPNVVSHLGALKIGIVGIDLYYEQY